MIYSKVRMTSTDDSRRKKGFTLIELLVVIAIISILAAILFPVFARARENARRSSCSSNLKQLSLGMFQYTQDYDEKFPPYNTNSAIANGSGWSFTIQPYVKSTQLLQCPSETAAPQADPDTEGYTDYATNLLLGYTPGSPATIDGKSLAVLTQPTLTVMLCDFSALKSTNWTTGCGYTITCGTGTLAELPNFGRHLDGVNFAYTDGHVKWSKMNINTVTNMYNSVTPGNVSLNSPTFNLTP